MLVGVSFLVDRKTNCCAYRQPDAVVTQLDPVSLVEFAALALILKGPYPRLALPAAVVLFM